MDEHRHDDLEDRLRALLAREADRDPPSTRRTKDAIDAAWRRHQARRATVALVVALGAVALIALTACLVP